MPTTTKTKVAGGLTGAAAVATALIGNFEGRNLIAYLDPVGIPTICEGITSGVHIGQKVTAQQCNELVTAEVLKKKQIVDKYVKVPVTENTEAALISFTYNVGEGNLRRSAVLKKLNAGDKYGGCKAMLQWVYAGGRKLTGLVKRRQAESELCLE